MAKMQQGNRTRRTIAQELKQPLLRRAMLVRFPFARNAVVAFAMSPTSSLHFPEFQHNRLQAPRTQHLWAVAARKASEPIAPNKPAIV